MSNLSPLVEHILGCPDRTVPFTVSKRLSEIFPEQQIFVTSDYDFEFSRYVRYSQIPVEESGRLWHELHLTWNSVSETIFTDAKTFAVRVTFQKVVLEVVRIELEYDTFHFIVGPTEGDVRRFFEEVCRFRSKAGGGSEVFSMHRWQPDDDLERSVDTASLDSLSLTPKFRKELESQTIDFFSSREAYQKYGIPWKRGVLMVGPPGNGKTQAIRAVANRVRVPRLFVRNFDGRYGQQPGIEECFEHVRRLAPCLLVLEDIDSLINKDDLSGLLNELDGAKPLEGVLTIATTNYPEKVDPSLKNRPSRFDRILKFESPSAELRKTFLLKANENWDAEMRFDEDKVDRLVGMTEGFSFAFMKELVTSATMKWIATSNKPAMHKVLGELAKSLQTQRA